MRSIYLIRHCQPAYPNGVKCCLGKLDLSLSEEGRLEAKKLATYFSKIALSTIITSPLARSRQTAEIISNGRYPIVSVVELEEIDTGLWDGLPFDLIKQKYPEDYQQRGENLARVPFPKGESYHQVLMRTEPCIEKMMKNYKGNLAIVGHTCVNQGLLSRWMGLDLEQAPGLLQSYGSISLIEIDKHTKKVKYVGKNLEAIPDQDECQAILERFQVGEDVRNHGRSVCELALEWTDLLMHKNYYLNRNLIAAAALLHDIARAEKEHAQIGADWINREGYPLVAEVIEFHHHLSSYDEERITEKTIVYLADKKVSGCQRVSIEERFNRSRKKCTTLVGRVKHRLAYLQAKKVEILLEEAMVY
ncbi:histidine phosphatase family protein [Acetobacterium sp.]|uniref:histidine phosphatase family protein n=1 Tax=Acetobacterium sp. TaxID=1872094 RepID=UPI00359415CD